MATITKKNDKWYVQIRRSFHKPIYKMFTAKSDAMRWSRETERPLYYNLASLFSKFSTK